MKEYSCCLYDQPSAYLLLIYGRFIYKIVTYCYLIIVHSVLSPLECRCSEPWDMFSSLGMKDHKFSALWFSHELIFLFHIYHDLSVFILFLAIYFSWVRLTWQPCECYKCVKGCSVLNFFVCFSICCTRS